jgi:hypothetical protein
LNSPTFEHRWVSARTQGAVQHAAYTAVAGCRPAAWGELVSRTTSPAVSHSPRVRPTGDPATTRGPTAGLVVVVPRPPFDGTTLSLASAGSMRRRGRSRRS